MKRCIANGMVIGLLCGGVILALGTPKVATAADDAVVQADRTLVSDLEKGNWPAAEKLLDKDFSWIDSQGVMWAEDEASQAKLKPLIPDASAATDYRAQVRQGRMDSGKCGKQLCRPLLGAASRGMAAAPHERNRG